MRESSEPGGAEAGLPDGGPLVLQVTLGDMRLEEAFRVTLPPRYVQLTVGGLVNEVFPEETTRQAQMASTLDVRANPDLPEIYNELLDIFRQWRRGDCFLGFSTGDGAEVELFHRTADHVRLGRQADRVELRLVIEQAHDVLARFAELGGDVDRLVQWLRSCTLLYFMDKRGFQLQVDPEDELDRSLLSIGSDLEARHLIAPTAESATYEITSEGRKFLGHVIEETESYIERFDVFNDVLHDAEGGYVEYGTGRGKDLRVQVYEAEGLDPIRVVFLLRLYDATVDGYADSWREDIFTEDFFNEILRPVLDRHEVDDGLIEWIIESGYAHIEETAEATRERGSQRETLRHISRE